MRHEHRPPRRRIRLTRRGRLALFFCLLLPIAAAALVPLLDGGGGPAPEKPRHLLIPEGWRAPQVYAAIDRVLKLPAGSAKAAAGSTARALPAEARGNPEGFLFPATYPVTSRTTPASLLAYMVDTARRKLATPSVAEGGKEHGLTPYQTAIVASIVEAEADSRADMGKVARVVHNRLARSMPLQMDSTLNYALNRTTVDTRLSETRIDSPFNTYRHEGLPPTPIGNPGLEAMAAAVAPTPGGWLYFVTVRPGDTRFAETYEEHTENVEEFNRVRAGAAPGRAQAGPGRQPGH